MTVNVQIRPEVEEKLVAHARSTGQSLEGYIQRLLESAAVAPDGRAVPVQTGTQKAVAFRSWAKSFPESLPILSLEDVSRERIYSQD
jgi:hypothetical protein